MRLQRFPCCEPEEEACGGDHDSPLAFDHPVVDPRVQHPSDAGSTLRIPGRPPEQDHRCEAGEKERSDGVDLPGHLAAEHVHGCGLQPADWGAEARETTAPGRGPNTMST